MLNVLLTIDTELWPMEWWNLEPGWEQRSYDAYIRGITPWGEFGVPYQLDLLERHGVRAVFFVEPLFAREVNVPLLHETVRIIQEAGQDVELHLHSEWNLNGKNPVVQDAKGKYLTSYSLNEQERLIAEGVRLLRDAGVLQLRAFRAGGYKCNLDTLRALNRLGIPFDTSYNASACGSGSPEFNQPANSAPRELEGVWELPVAVFDDRPSHLRPVQLGACSFNEMSAMMEQAWRDGADTFVIVSHSSELLTRDKRAPDRIVRRRFESLLRHLQAHPNRYRTVGFGDLDPAGFAPAKTRAHLRSNVLRTGWRMLEQRARRYPLFNRVLAGMG